MSTGALNQLGLSLRLLRELASRSIVFGDGDMRVEITLENEHQLHSLRQAFYREMELWMDPMAPASEFSPNEFKSLLMGIPLRLQVRRPRETQLRDLDHAQQLLKKVRSSL